MKEGEVRGRVDEFGASGTTVGRPAPAAARTELMPSGFASPAQDWFEDRIDLNRHLVPDITSTYIVRVSGHAMEGAGISDGDELIVDRALRPRDGSVVIAVLDGELVIRRLRVASPDPGSGAGAVTLVAASAAYPDMPVPDPEDLVIWGVATRCLHRV
ncbi:translesion error-prone DNA polymerase V autoproteolytic subunit [Arthrobacter sp. KR32]|uniref:Translesion error-prone DNA polymerase V autoproteolytic subunit n=2 Tax=Arthrobacter bussei TaxID=2594179 RepID=A0A7X1TMF6_9MICC|nr:translesion error-prone DNA polymerase V autoproteolytic subunit [Arthrobacter bussei]MPY09639.1 translesion error-prone DNA polymerase V autoproteolytic subunit [Arthrobacter bussei]